MLKIKNRSGFTIVELAVVITIIVILAGIVLVNVTQYVNKAKIVAIKANMGVLQTASTTLQHSDEFDATSSFDDFCGDEPGPYTNTYSKAILTAIDGIHVLGLSFYCWSYLNSGTMSCGANGINNEEHISKWYALYHYTVDNTWFCVDYDGHTSTSDQGSMDENDNCACQ